MTHFDWKRALGEQNGEVFACLFYIFYSLFSHHFLFCRLQVGETNQYALTSQKGTGRLGRVEKKNLESAKSLLTNRINFPNRKLFTRARLQIENFLPGRVLTSFLAHSKTAQRIRSAHVEGY